MLICPLCQNPLQPLTAKNNPAKSWRCIQGHSFDQARQGYLNLLPVQHKRSRQPGDDKAMVQARQQFLNAGYYQPLADQLWQTLMPVLQEQRLNSISMLDAGCGEGYYSEKLASKLTRQYGNNRVYGMDISKAAILQACKRSHNIQWLVASISHIPLASADLDLIVSIFSPLASQEWRRCLKPTGLLAVVSPGAGHLQPLKALLYDEPKAFDEYKLFQQLNQDWRLLTESPLSYDFELTEPTLIQALLAMTPHSWRISPERKTRIQQLNTLSCQADFIISIWQRKDTHYDRSTTLS